MTVVRKDVSVTGKMMVGKIPAKELGWVFYNAGNYHAVANIEKMCQGILLYDQDRKPLLQPFAVLIDNAPAWSDDTVFAGSSLKHACGNTWGTISIVSG